MKIAFKSFNVYNRKYSQGNLYKIAIEAQIPVVSAQDIVLEVMSNSKAYESIVTDHESFVAKRVIDRVYYQIRIYDMAHKKEKYLIVSKLDLSVRS